MYVVEYESLLPRDINPVLKNYVISELKNAVKLIDHINIYYTLIYATLSSGAWLRVMIYICVYFILYIIVLVNC